MRQMIGPVEFARRMQAFETPTWGYRRGRDGEVEQDLFDGKPKKGWADSPAGLGGEGD